MTTKYLDSTGLSYFWSKVKERDDADRGSIFFGIVDDTSTSTAFTATIDGVTEYHDGLAILLKNGVVTSAAGFTIDINGLGAKPSYNNMAAATADTTIFNVNYTMLFVYDSTRVAGGAWICYRGYNSNDNTIGYQIRTNVSSLPMKSVTYRYRLLFTSADGKGFVPATNSTSTNATASRTVCQDPIDPFGRIVYYSTTTSVAAGSRPSVTTLWDRYNITLGYSFNRTGAALTLTSWKPVYIKCAPQNDGSAIIDSTTPYVQDLPTTADGKIYIALGIAYSATQVELFLEHPVYHFSQGSIRMWSNEKWTINEHEATNNNFTISASDVGALSSSDLPDEISDNVQKYQWVLVVNASTAFLVAQGAQVPATFVEFAGRELHGVETLYLQVLNGAMDVSQASARLFKVTSVDMTTASVGMVSVDNGTIYSVALQDAGNGLIGTYSEMDVQDTNNLVTSISSSSTNTQYPSAKCVYDIVGNVESLLSAI